MNRRVDDGDARQALSSGSIYTAPLQTMHRSRALAMPNTKHFSAIFEAAMGRAEL
jgi:hypothetical protein